MASDDFITLADLSRWLSMPERRLAQWAKRGELPGAQMIGGRWRVSRRVIDRWIGVLRAASERKAEMNRSPSRPLTHEEAVRQLLESPPSALRDKLLGRFQREQQRLTKRSE